MNAPGGPSPSRVLDPRCHPAAWITHDVPGTGGIIKERPEDFFVEELPAYEPCGQGEHVYLFIEKKNLPTMRVVRLLADHFGVRRDAIGFAGLKDKLAVTRQLFSVHVPGKTADDFPALVYDGVSVLWVDQHANKLRRGHLAGNRFVIRIRRTDPGRIVYAHRALARMLALGAPNRIGVQRFGTLVNNHLVGLSIILGEHGAALDALLGPPEPGAWSPASQHAMRRLYAAAQFEQAMHAAPVSLHAERRALAALARGAGPKAAIRAIERMDRSFYVSALQSALFNAVLDDRIAAGALGLLEPGDIAFKHVNGAVFRVDTEALGDDLTSRLRALDISPSGPMWGPGMMTAESRIGELELAGLARAGLSPSHLDRLAHAGLDGVQGSRRPLRVPLRFPDVESGVDEHGPYIRCTFELPRGSFATSVMQEIIKPAPGHDITLPPVDTSAAAPPDPDHDPQEDDS